MNIHCLIFPNQLFSPEVYLSHIHAISSTLAHSAKDIPDIPDKEDEEDTESQPFTLTIHVIEHSLFYGHRAYKYIADPPSKSPKASPMKFNKRKLVFHRASMTIYVDEWQDYKKKVNTSMSSAKRKTLGISSISSIHFHESVSSMSSLRSIASHHNPSKHSYVVYMDVVDHELQYDLNRHHFKDAFCMNSPSFLWSTCQLLEYAKVHKPTPAVETNAPSSLSHASFYKESLRIHDIPYITQSHDKENRNSFSSMKQVPSPSYKTYTHSYLTKAIQWVNSHSTYKHHPGQIEKDDMWLPMMRKGAHAHLASFLKTDLKNFGKYQDAMVAGRPFLHHSLLSALLNVGLLTPREVVDETVSYYKSHRKSIPLASYEGFLRQVVGWREYERLIYVTLYHEMVTSNVLGHSNKLAKVWYQQDAMHEKWTTQYPLLPLQDAIHQAWTYGYLHHIYRLMVVSNAMNLMEVHPYEAYRWFMEFSVDSYDWVMIGNVYSMGMWADGGKTMRKPYLSSNAYIDSMSLGYDADKDDQKDKKKKTDNKEESWGEIWRALFYAFLSNHSSILGKTIYARNLATYRKMNASTQQSMKTLAKTYIKRYTKG